MSKKENKTNIIKKMDSSKIEIIKKETKKENDKSKNNINKKDKNV